tara:strand:+ start:556 stop:3771 length:3216 start_codon:yes stop_codon:yes gene_type:complete
MLFMLVITSEITGQVMRNNWLGGSETTNAKTVKGASNVSDPSFIPGARRDITGWQDTLGNFYIYGGKGYSDNLGRQSDLWKWNGSEWSYINGDVTSGSAIGVYGTKGLADPSNHPGGRSSANGWIDSDQNLWLFGGEGYATTNAPTSTTRGELNDLWMWDGSNWKWVNGTNNINEFSVSTSGVGTGQAGDYPGARQSSFGGFIDGKYYLFGGYGRTSATTENFLMDVWSYDLSSDIWTWEKGLARYSALSQVEYGTMGVENSSNQPGPRSRGVSWVDDQGNFWIYGGKGIDGVDGGTINYLNDLWRYNTANNNWTWINGSSTGNQQLDISQGNAHPGARVDAVSWLDHNGDFWLFGGNGYDVNGDVKDLNDFWRWDGTEWHFEGGSSVGDVEAPTTGTLNSLGSNSDNVLKSRAGSIAFIDQNEEVHIFGGARSSQTNQYFNDFWKVEYGMFWDIVPNTTNKIWDGGFPATNNFNVYIKESYPAYQAVQNGSAIRQPDIVANNIFLESILEIVWESESDFDNVFVHGNLVLNGGSLAGFGDLIFDNSDEPQNINGNGTLDFEGVVRINSGVQLQTNDKLRLTATNTTFGQLKLEDNTSKVKGDVELQKWIDLDNSSSNGRYFHLCSPLLDVNIEDFAVSPGIIESGNMDPSKNTVWQFNAATALWESTDLTNNSADNKSLVIYAGTNTSGNFLTSDGQAGNIALVGEVNSDVETTKKLYYHDGQGVATGFVGSGTVEFTEGWNLVANPFTTLLGLKEALSSSSGIQPKVYTWNGTDYSTATLVGNIITTTNGGIAYIKPLESFFVQVDISTNSLNNGDGPSPLHFIGKGFDASKTRNLGVFSPSKKSNSLNAIHIILEDGKVKKDCWVGFHDEASKNYDKKFDTWKLFGHDTIPAIYTRAENAALALNFLNTDPNFHQIPLLLGNKNAHGKLLALNFETDDLETYTEVWLEDRKINRFVDIINKPRYQFNFDTLDGEFRFVLHFSKNNISEEKNDINNQLYTYENENGHTVVVFYEDQKNSQLSVYDMSGKIIEKVDVQGSRVVLKNLFRTGLYIIKFQGEKGTFSKKIIK